MATQDPPLVLLVEDDRLTRTVLRDCLKQCGFNVDAAENGAVALDKLSGKARRSCQKYSLILTDFFMPKVNGEQLVTRLRASEKFRHIPVAVMSSNDASEDVERLRQLGVADYLVKPLSKARLSSLRRLLSTSAESRLCGDDAAPPAPALLDAVLVAPDSAPRAPDRKPSDHPRAPEPSAFQENATSAESTSDGVRCGSPPSCDASHADVVGRPAPTSSDDQPDSKPFADIKNHEGMAIKFVATDQSQGKHVAVMMPVYLQYNVANGVQFANSGAVASTKLAAAQTQGKNGAVLCQVQSSRALATRLARKAALERFRAKKAKSQNAPRVRYVARKKLAEARPRYKGQFVKAETKAGGGMGAPRAPHVLAGAPGVGMRADAGS